MEITIRRSSVCMADDIEDHSVPVEIAEEDTFTSVFKKLVDNNYFPAVQGDDVLWVMIVDPGKMHDDLITWFVKDNVFYSRFVKDEPRIRDTKRWREISLISFDYYARPQERARKIFSFFKGSKFHIWHEGFNSEYLAHKVTKEQEALWKNEIEQTR